MLPQLILMAVMVAWFSLVSVEQVGYAADKTTILDRPLKIVPIHGDPFEIAGITEIDERETIFYILADGTESFIHRSNIKNQEEVSHALNTLKLGRNAQGKIVATYSTRPTAPPPQPTPPVNTIRISSSDFIACRSRATKEDLRKLAVSGDKEAFGKALARTVLADQCTVLQKGSEVYLEEATVFSGLVKVRIKGTTVGLWTDSEAIK